MALVLLLPPPMTPSVEAWAQRDLAPPALLLGPHVTNMTSLFFLIRASLPGFRAILRKTAPDTGSEPDQTIPADAMHALLSGVPLNPGMCNAEALGQACSTDH